MRTLIAVVVLALAFAPGAEAKQVTKPKPKPCKQKPGKGPKRKPGKLCKPVKPAKPKPPASPAAPNPTEDQRRQWGWIESCNMRARSLYLVAAPGTPLTPCRPPTYMTLPAGMYDATNAVFIYRTATPEQQVIIDAVAAAVGQPFYVWR